MKDFEKVYCTRCFATRNCIKKKYKPVKKTESKYFIETKLKVKTKLTATIPDFLEKHKTM